MDENGGRPDFERALAFVLEMEGGYVNHPDDPGGATNKGVTQAVYDAHRKAIGQAPRSVREITQDEIERIYHARYWLAAKCDQLPWPLSLFMFDSAVNHGVAGATKILQRALSLKDDGIFGPVTLAAVRAAHTGSLYGLWFAARLKFYYDIVRSRPRSAAFLLGWIRRLVHLNAAVGKLA